jgi:flagellar basal body-associated protein FliL
LKRKLIQKILIVAFAIVMMIAIPFKTNAAKGTPGGENGTTETTTEKPGKTTESTTESTTEPSVLKPSQPPALTEEPSTDEEPGAGDSQEPTTEATTEKPGKTTESTTEADTEDSETTTEETTKPKNEDRTVEEKTESDDKKIVASKGDPDKDKEGKGIPTTFIIIGVCALVVIIALIVVIAVLLSARKKNSAPVTTVTPDIPPNDFDDTLPPIPPAFAAGAADGNSGVLAGQAVGAGSGILAAGAAAAAVNAVRPDATVQAPGSLPIQLDIYNGESPTGSRTLYMAQDLIIGSGPNCDIIFSEPYVSGQNTRIFLQNGTVMIEDMNSTNGTYAAGLRVNKAAPLKSGDVISIGEAEFCLKF